MFPQGDALCEDHDEDASRWARNLARVPRGGQVVFRGRGPGPPDSHLADVTAPRLGRTRPAGSRPSCRPPCLDRQTKRGVAERGHVASLGRPALTPRRVPVLTTVCDCRCHSLSVVVRDLAPGRRHVFRVRAENVHGLSEPSTPSLAYCTPALSEYTFYASWWGKPSGADPGCFYCGWSAFCLLLTGGNLLSKYIVQTLGGLIPLSAPESPAVCAAEADDSASDLVLRRSDGEAACLAACLACAALSPCGQSDHVAAPGAGPVQARCQARPSNGSSLSRAS